MDRILKIQKKENGPRASSAPALEYNTIIFIHVYWYMQQISGERLQDHWSSGFTIMLRNHSYLPHRYSIRFALFLMTLDTRVLAGGGARGQNLGHLFFFFFFMHSVYKALLK